MLNAAGVAITDTTHIGHINPHRYRSYYYDTETGLYYLKNRYYAPDICRFISMDDISFADPGSINGLNLYAYCGNNPVMRSDPYGSEWWHWALSGFVTAIGIGLCFVPGAQVLGVSLLVSGISMLASNTLSSLGVNSVTATWIMAGMDLVAGTILCFTPFAAVGASMIGSAIGSIAGGYISQALGGSFELGSSIGGIVGGIAGGKIYSALQNACVVGKWVRLNSVTVNPKDDAIINGYYDRALNHWTRSLASNPRGYNSIKDIDGAISRIEVIIGSNNMLANGHHRIYVLKNILKNAPRYIKVFLTK